MAKLSKRLQAFAAKVDRQKLYPVDDALALVKECASAKFDESIDVAVQLGIDAKKSDQVVRGSVVLPAGTGKSVRVAVFAQGEKAEQARAAGAEIVGMEDLAEQVKAGNLNFDVVIASPDTMRVVGTLGQILGPRGLMPNPKVGTVTADVAHGCKERQGRSGSVPCRQGRHHPRDDRPCFVRAGVAASESVGAGRSPAKGEAGNQQGCVPAQDRIVEHHGCWRARRSGHARVSKESCARSVFGPCVKGFGRLWGGSLLRSRLSKTVGGGAAGRRQP